MEIWDWLILIGIALEVFIIYFVTGINAKEKGMKKPFKYARKILFLLLSVLAVFSIVVMIFKLENQPIALLTFMCSIIISTLIALVLSTMQSINDYELNKKLDTILEETKKNNYKER